MIQHTFRQRWKKLSLLLVFALLFTSLPVRTQARGSLPSSPMRTSASAPEGDLSEEVLFDAAPMQISQRQPVALTHPLLLTRVQSAATADGLLEDTLVVTLTVRNNLSPASVPLLLEGATITDTLAAFDAIDLTNDANTLRNVLLEDTLLAGATLMAASATPDERGSQVAWSLGDLPPLSSTTVTLTLRLPPSAPDTTPFDAGATAWATLHGRPVSTQAVPVALVAPANEVWLRSTIDANTTDPSMLQQAGALEYNPDLLFAFVRDLAYEAYSGSLRGTRGTLWSQAGNALDQASLLIAMLRASGIPSRYRHGTLSDERARELLRSMFRAPISTVGTLPADAERADPLNDPQLLAEARDHWWVEAFLPGAGWQDLDPAFALAQVGDRFVSSDQIATDGTDQIVEIPDALRHKVIFQVKVEQFSQLTAIHQGLETVTPLNVTLNAVELVGEPVSLFHLVNTEASGGLVFSAFQHVYTPLLNVGGQEYIGDTFQEYLSSFPLGSVFVSGVWVVLETRAPDGTGMTYERDLVDRLGYAARHGAGNVLVDLAVSANSIPAINPFDVLTMLVAPGWLSQDAFDQRIPELLAQQAAIQQVQDELAALDPTSSAAQELVREAQGLFLQGVADTLGAQLFQYYLLADEFSRSAGAAALTRVYADAPRLVTLGQAVVQPADPEDPPNVQIAMDLVQPALRTVVSPFQAAAMATTAPGILSLIASTTEHELLRALDDSTTLISVQEVFEAAAAQGIPTVAIGAENLDDLADLDLSAEARARIQQAVERGQLVLTPAQMVTIGPETTVGWYEFDVETGAFVDTMENGRHSAIEYIKVVAAAAVAFAVVASGTVILGILQLAPALAPCSMVTTAAGVALLLLTNAISLLSAFASGLAAAYPEDALLIFGMLAASIVVITEESTFIIIIAGVRASQCSTSQGGGSPRLAQAPADEVTAPPTPLLPFLLDTAAGRQIDLGLGTDLLARDVQQVAVAAKQGTANLGLAATLNTALTAVFAETGMASLYAPPLVGLGVGGDGTGFGVANFDAAAALTLTDSAVLVGPTSDTLQVGGATLDLRNGLALPGYTGRVDITTASDTTDQLVLDGVTDFFTLNAVPASSSNNTTTPVTFQAEVISNIPASYTFTVEAPRDWIVELDEQGAVTATPPTGAEPGEYSILVAAQSVQSPELVLAAEHRVTLTAFEGVALSLTPDTGTTLPWGTPADEAQANPLNNGQAQLTGLTFAVHLTNTSTLSHTFNIAARGAPEGWLVLNGVAGATNTSITLPPGGVARIGLYVIPAGDTLPPAGTSYPITVEAVATDNAALTAQATRTATIPELAYGYLTTSAATIYSAPGGSGAFGIHLRNVGTASGTFPLTVLPYSTTWRIEGVQTPLSVAVNATSTQTVTVQTPDGKVGQTSFIDVTTRSGAYLQARRVEVELVSLRALCVYQAAQAIPGMTGAALAAALRHLGQQIDRLDSNLTDAEQLEATGEALQQVADQVGVQAGLASIRDQLRALAQALAEAATSSDVATHLADICTVLGPLPARWEIVTQYAVAARFNPGAIAALPGQSVTTALLVSNRGTRRASYRVTFTGALSGLPAPAIITLEPGAETTIPVVLTPERTGFVELAAVVEAVDQNNNELGISSQASAAVNVVDAFVRILGITADPDFVETGTSATTLMAQIANIANVPRLVVAHTEIISPDGQVVQTLDADVQLRLGDPFTYTLGMLNTSGYASGVYTVRVELRDTNGLFLPEGSGYGYLTVGQGVWVDSAVSALLVAPGTVSVTTTISTRIRQRLGALQQQPALSAAPERSGMARAATTAEGMVTSGDTNVHKASTSAQLVTSGLDQPFYTAGLAQVSSTPAITRYEEVDPTIAYAGTWTSIVRGPASGGAAIYADDLGETALLTFTGEWVSVGFVTNADAGQAEVFIDGVSQGSFDTYSRAENVMTRLYAGLGTGTHAISIAVLASRNPFASNDRVHLDYIDVWDGTTLPEGSFEQDSARVHLSNGWATQNDANASGGSYVRALGSSNAWFHFTGSSVSLHTIRNADSRMRILIDGQVRGDLDFSQSDTLTPTVSFGNLGSGIHVVQVQVYRGMARLDRFSTPGTPPFYSPPPPGTGVIRYEEDAPELLYNGTALESTASSWAINNNNNASARYMARSRTAGDSVSLTFTGSWVNLGLLTGNQQGQAEVFIDGISQGVVDTYSREDDSRSLVYANLGAGTHTISFTVLGVSNPLARLAWVSLDYIDVWDGTPLPEGSFEQDSARVYLTGGWSLQNDPRASGGSYLTAPIAGTAWFHFTGSSVSLHAIQDDNSRMRILIDGRVQGDVHFSQSATPTPTVSFGNLGSGVHVLQVQAYRGAARLDRFSVPGEPPFYSPPPDTGIIRYEENAPEVLYNGFPLATTGASWDDRPYAYASGGYGARSNVAGDTISLTFTGAWINLGLLTDSGGGETEIFIDGVSQGIVDTYSAMPDAFSRIYDNLISATHTLSLTVLGTGNPGSSNTYLLLDYIDIWDGTPMPAGTFEHDNRRVYVSDNWSLKSNPAASSATYIRSDRTLAQTTNAWFHFTGNSVRYVGITDPAIDSAVELFIDEVSQGIISPTYAFSPVQRGFDYTGLDDGPHVVRISNVSQGTLDTLVTPVTEPFVQDTPLVEWFVSDLGSGSEIQAVRTSATAGDINQDGSVELLVTSSRGTTGTLSVLRGDGADAGSGSPLIWDVPVGLGDTPAIANLDDDPFAEIVVGSDQGVFAFNHDGTRMWFSDVIRPYFIKNRIGVETGPWGGAAIGNLDDDPSPEIVAVGHLNPGVQQQRLVVFKADGTVAASYDLPVRSTPFTATPPVLADLTGDGKLDILVGQQYQLLLLDYAPSTPELVWTRAVTLTYPPSTIWAEGTWGSPAIADVDGKQPGGDSGPEIVMAWDTRIELLDADGSVIWDYPTAGVNPGSVSVADTDGDGEVEVITVMKRPYPAIEQDIYVLNADGSLLWTVEVIDRTTSASGVSVADLESDGVYEVLWNGNDTGLAIFRGTDGSVVFNEPLINSGTINDYPITADVDNDGAVEIIAGDAGGIYVVGFDEEWGPARPLWNQYNYAITNINDDLSVPATETPGWLVHNTYRTQSELVNPVPVYTVTVKHTLPNSGVVALPATFEPLPDQPAPAIQWQYRQGAFETARTARFGANLPNMQPGEVRQISTGTEVLYTLASGDNRRTLPPLYVAAAHIIAVEPFQQQGAAGTVAAYTVELFNPGVAADTYTLSVSGLPESWNVPAQPVAVPGASRIRVSLAIPLPLDATPDSYAFAIRATNGAGGSDQAQASLMVTLPPAQLTMTPPLREAAYGEMVTYTLRLSNLESPVNPYEQSGPTRTYQIELSGLAANQVSLPMALTVASGSSVSATIYVTAGASPGFYPFVVSATTDEVNPPIQVTTQAALQIVSAPAVEAALSPVTVTAGRATPARFTLLVTNTGSLSDSYDLAVQLPSPEWSYALLANELPQRSLTLPPDVFNLAALILLVTPPIDTLPATYPISVVVTSRTHASVQAIASGQVDVAPQGVSVEIIPGSISVQPAAAQRWDVRVTNTGSTGDTFDLAVGGFLATNAQLSSRTVALTAGGTQTVQLGIDNLSFSLAGSYPFAVTARSQTAPDVAGSDKADVTIQGFESAVIMVDPISATLVPAIPVTYQATISNTGNVDTLYQLSARPDGADLEVELAFNEVYIPAGMAAEVALRVHAPGPVQPGSYPVRVQARSTAGTTVEDTVLAVIRGERVDDSVRVYLPFVRR